MGRRGTVVLVVGLSWAAFSCGHDNPTFHPATKYVAPPPENTPIADADIDPWWGFSSLEECLEFQGTRVTRDGDGDGVVGVWLVGCGGEAQSVPDSEDCDDADPTRARKQFRDADGDGVTTGNVVCLPYPTPGYQTYASYPGDCDDTAPDRQVIAFADADGDGYGDLNNQRCVAKASPQPPGLSIDAGDCNDGDPAIHPGATEHWNDGVDSNCDRKEDPLGCSSDPANCGCDLLSVTGAAVDSSCKAADLYLVDQRVCRACAGINVLLVGNRGTRPVVGGFDLVTPDGYKLHVDEDLPSSGVSHPIAFHRPLAPSVRIVTSAAECDLTNNELELPSAQGICDP
jgi:hypothetical protein